MLGVRVDELSEAGAGGAGVYGCPVDGAGDVRPVRRLERVE